MTTIPPEQRKTLPQSKIAHMIDTTGAYFSEILSNFILTTISGDDKYEHGWQQQPWGHYRVHQVGPLIIWHGA